MKGSSSVIKKAEAKPLNWGLFPSGIVKDRPTVFLLLHQD